MGLWDITGPERQKIRVQAAEHLEVFPLVPTASPTTRMLHDPNPPLSKHSPETSELPGDRAPGKQVKSVKGFVGFKSSRESLAHGFPSSGRGRKGKKGLALLPSVCDPWGKGLARAPFLPRWLEFRKVWEVASSFSSKSMIQFSSSEATEVKDWD